MGRKAGIIAEPQLTCHFIDAQLDEFLILASDGVWDCLSNEEVVAMINAQGSLVRTVSPESDAEAAAESAAEAISTSAPSPIIGNAISDSEPDSDGSPMGQYHTTKHTTVTVTDSSASSMGSDPSSLISSSSCSLPLPPGHLLAFAHLDLQALCDAVVSEATQRFIEREDISDDTSIIIVRL
jgi:hypothetical protein